MIIFCHWDPGVWVLCLLCVCRSVSVLRAHRPGQSGYLFTSTLWGSCLMSFDVSSSKQALSFGDSGGCVHLWSSAPEVSYNSYSRETELALPCLVDSLPQLVWNHELMPLSLLPMPLTSTEPLLSDWPTSLITPSPRYDYTSYRVSKIF